MARSIRIYEFEGVTVNVSVSGPHVVAREKSELLDSLLITQGAKLKQLGYSSTDGPVAMREGDND